MRNKPSAAREDVRPRTSTAATALRASWRKSESFIQVRRARSGREDGPARTNTKKEESRKGSKFDASHPPCTSNKDNKTAVRASHQRYGPRTATRARALGRVGNQPLGLNGEASSTDIQRASLPRGPNPLRRIRYEALEARAAAQATCLCMYGRRRVISSAGSRVGAY